MNHGFKDKSSVAMAIERVKQETMIAANSGLKLTNSLLNNIKCALLAAFGLNRHKDAALPGVLWIGI